MTNNRLAICLFLILLFSAFGVSAQNVPVDFEFGFRFTDIEGNEDLYRTQVNEREGFVLRSLTFFTTDFDGPDSGILDHFRLDATDIGHSPANSFRIDAGRAEAYRLRIGYRAFDVFSAHPSFANPLLAQGVFPGQHTIDRNRMMFDADLEILPWSERFTPFIGYSQSRYDGPGTTTYALGGDEFRLRSNLDEKEREIRVGTSFSFSHLYGAITQGWRSIESSEDLKLFGQGGAGNNNTPILGRQLFAETFERRGGSDGDMPFTNIYLTGVITPRIRLVGDFVVLSGENDSFEDESAEGSFLSFPARRFFGGFEESVTSTADLDAMRGGLRGEFRITDRAELLAGYRTERRETSGTALIDTILRDSITFGGGSPGDFAEELHADSAFNRDIDTLETAVAYRPFAPLMLRLGVSRSDYEYEITPDISEISVEGSQGGDFSRSVNGFDAAAAYTDSMFAVSASYRREDADNPVVRTDFVDRNRVRLRVGFTSPARVFRASLAGEETDQDSKDQNIGFDSNARQFTADAELAPWQTFRIRAAYTQVRVDSYIRFRRPENFALDTSHHDEDLGITELGFAMIGNPVSLEADAARIENVGSLRYDSLRYRARLVYDFQKNMGLAAEFARDDYEETEEWGQYDANRFGIFFRYRP